MCQFVFHFFLTSLPQIRGHCFPLKRAHNYTASLLKCVSNFLTGDLSKCYLRTEENSDLLGAFFFLPGANESTFGALLNTPRSKWVQVGLLHTLAAVMLPLPLELLWTSPSSSVDFVPSAPGASPSSEDVGSAPRLYLAGWSAAARQLGLTVGLWPIKTRGFQSHANIPAHLLWPLSKYSPNLHLTSLLACLGESPGHLRPVPLCLCWLGPVNALPWSESTWATGQVPWCQTLGWS